MLMPTKRSLLLAMIACVLGALLLLRRRLKIKSRIFFSSCPMTPAMEISGPMAAARVEACHTKH